MAIGATIRVDAGNWITGKTVIGQRGRGILAQDVPTSGTHGAPPIYNDLSFPADNNKEVRWQIITPPASGAFFAYENGSFTYLGGANSLTYKLWVEGADMGNATVSLNGGTADSVAPVMNGTLSNSYINSGGFTLSWLAASDNVAVAGYKLSLDNGVTYAMDLGNVLITTLTGLLSSTLYNVKVKAYDAVGNFAAPLSTTVTTSALPDNTAPTMNGSLNISSITSSGFTSAWLAASDNIGVTGYEISVDLGTPAYSSLANVLTTSKTGMVESTLYNVRVRAVDAAGNRSVPLTTTVTTATISLTTLPLSRKIRTSTNPQMRTLSSDATYFVYNIGTSQELVFYNKSENSVTMNIMGNLADVASIPGAGDDTVSLAGGMDVIAAPGVFTFMSLDQCYAYLVGDVSVTADTDDAVVACLLV